MLNDASGECIATHLFSFALASSCLPLRDMKYFIDNDSKGKQGSQVQGYKENWANPLCQSNFTFFCIDPTILI